MNIDITARGFSLSDSLKSFVNEKSLLLTKYDSNISSAKSVLIKEGRAEKIELIVSSKKTNYIAKCHSSVFEKTMVNAINKVKSQIERKLNS